MTSDWIGHISLSSEGMTLLGTVYHFISNTQREISFVHGEMKNLYKSMPLLSFFSQMKNDTDIISRMVHG